LALFAAYQRTGRQEDALLGALVASLVVQTRPEMIFFPAVVVAFFLCVLPRGWRRVFARPTLLAGAALAVLLVPHALDVIHVARQGLSPSPHVFPLQRYLDTLLLLDPGITPIISPRM